MVKHDMKLVVEPKIVLIIGRDFERGFDFHGSDIETGANHFRVAAGFALVKDRTTPEIFLTKAEHPQGGEEDGQQNSQSHIHGIQSLQPPVLCQEKTQTVFWWRDSNESYRVCDIIAGGAMLSKASIRWIKLLPGDSAASKRDSRSAAVNSPWQWRQLIRRPKYSALIRT